MSPETPQKFNQDGDGTRTYSKIRDNIKFYDEENYELIKRRNSISTEIKNKNLANSVKKSPSE